MIRAFLAGVILCLTGCAGVSIDWAEWRVPEVDDGTPDRLLARARQWKADLLEAHLSEEGLLLYRIPATPDPETGVRLDLADQACWSGYLLAALAFEEATSPGPENRALIARVLGGLEELHLATGVDGLIARCLLPSEMVGTLAHRTEEWQPAAHHGGAHWRGAPSRDQYAGYLLGLVATWQLAEDPAIQARAAALLETIALFLERGGWKIRDGAGRVVRFGDLRGRMIGVPIGVNSAISLMALAIAVESEDPELRDAGLLRIPHLVRSLRPLHFEVLGVRNYSNDVMAAAGLVGVALGPTPAPVRREIRRAVRPFLRSFRGEGNAFFCSLAALYGLGDPAEEEAALRNLLSAPDSRAIREIDESVFADLPRRWLPDRKLRRRSRAPLPLVVRPPSSFVWRSDPYLLDRKVGATGETIVSGVDLLFAYWLGRFTGWIPAPGSSPETSSVAPEVPKRS